MLSGETRVVKGKCLRGCGGNPTPVEARVLAVVVRWILEGAPDDVAATFRFLTLPRVAVPGLWPQLRSARYEPKGYGVHDYRMGTQAEL